MRDEIKKEDVEPWKQGPQHMREVKRIPTVTGRKHQEGDVQQT